MLSSVIRVALVQRLLILLLGLAISVLGAWSFNQLPIDAFPDISAPQVQVIVKAPGMTPTEVEQRITVPIELEMQGIENQKILRSITKYSLSIVTIDFKDGTDIYWARQQVTEKLNQVWGLLPEGVDGGLAPITTPLGEIYMYEVTGNHLSMKDRRWIQDWVIRPRLRSVEGVADVNSLGGEVQAYEIIVKPEALARFGLDINDVISAIRRNNRDAGGDRISKADKVILVKTIGKIDNIEGIDEIPIKTLSGSPLRIKDVAEVKISSLTRYGGVTSSGEGEIVTGLVLLRKGANSRSTVQGIKERMKEIESSLPEGVGVRPFYDRTELVQTAVWTVESALAQAIVLVFIVLILMLGNFRSALVVSLNLPLSVLFTFLLMNIFGISANLMSLGGIAIAIGILIDSSIVVVENIHSQLSSKDERLGKLHLIYRAVEEVSVPVVSGVAIIIIVFIPLFSLTGLEAKMFTPLAVTISFAMACALFLSLTVVPVLASFIMKKSSSNEGALLKNIIGVYRPIVKWALDKRAFAVGLALILLVGALALFPFIGKEFMPSMDEGTTVVIIEKDPAITLEKSLADDEHYQKAMMSLPEVIGVISRTGADELRLDPMDLYQTDNFLLTRPRSEWNITRKEFEEKVREQLNQFQGLDIAFTQPIDMRVSEMITGVRAAMAIKLFGDDIETLEQKSKQIEKLVNQVQGSVDVIRTEINGQQYLQIDTDSRRIAKYGLSTEEVNQIIEVAVAGKVISEVLEKERRVGVLVRYPEGSRSDIESISEILISTPTGNKIPIKEIANVTEVDGPFQIARESTKRQVVVQANVEDRDVVSFVDEVKEKIEKEIDLPKGYYVTFGGQFENQQRAAKRLAMVIPTSIALIFLILFMTFRSSSQSLLIILNIPFALIGGIVALYLSGMYMSVPASVGFIALFGVAVMNGVVMVTYFNQLRGEGKPILEAVKLGAERRLRPVLMTASITILGLLPLLLATGPGSELQKPLSVVVIGGTITSTLLTLILLPTLYAWIEEKSERKVRGLV